VSLILYQAGAGSGKTYTITQEIVGRLATGEARPECILATTFTRKAAAELKDRIQTRLLRPEDDDPDVPLERRLALADSLDEALVGTVHSVGHQVLSRYALHLGISPQLEPVEETARERHLRLVVAEMSPDGLRDLDRLARRFPLEAPQDLVLKILDQKRANAIPDDAFRASMMEGTERLIQVISGGTSVDLPGFDGFYDVCNDALARIEGNGDETKTTQGARQELGDLVRAAMGHWQAWGKAAKLKWAKKSDDAVRELTALARRANVHAGLHADLRAFTACLVERVLELQQRYRTYKATHGLVDFTDLEERFLELLRDEKVATDLAASLDLVVVDEFQDTNPIQLAIFRRLAGLAKASIWVGDAKQAIYGFRGTDARLMQDVVKTVPAPKTLPKNWRSRAGLVEAVNDIFEPVFGPGTRLQPHHPEEARMERWLLEGKNKVLRREAFLAQLQELLEDEDPAHVAVLVRRNDEAKEIAGELRALGVPALVQTSGLLRTKEGASMVAGLRLVADPGDRLAAAMIQSIEDPAETPAWFPRAVQEPESVLDAASVRALAQIRARAMPPSGVVGAVIQALSLADRVAAWGEPAKRAANLDELVALAQRYEDEAEQQGKAATVTELIYWLENLKAKGEDLLPVPAGVPAVRVMTLHGSKGLEWPVVVLFQDGSPKEPNPFGIRVGGGDPAADPLAGRWIHYWTYPFGTTEFGLNAEGSGIQDAAKASPEGEALKQAELDETRRLLYVGFTRAKRALIIAEATKSPLAALPSLDDVLPWDGEGPHVVRVCNGVPEPKRGDDGSVAWLEAARGPHEHVARYWSPSKANSVACEVHAEKLPGEHPFPRTRAEDWTSLGQAVHAYLAALPALRGTSSGVKEEHAHMSLRRWGQEGVVEAEALVKAGKRFEAWVQQHMPGATWHAEVPVTGPRPEGGQWIGAIDLLLETPDGLVVVDHKSADYAPEGWGEKALEHSGQIAAYAWLAGAERGYIHLPLGGGVVRV
jgi:ATP-dependent helicase/nuclease subunit A